MTKPIRIYRQNGKLLFSFERGFPENGFATRLNIGPGAGYKGGCTIYLAFNSGSRHWVNNRRGGYNPWNGFKPYSLFTRLTGIELGITRNANVVPFMNH
jgi:hypothetical protein